MLNQLYSVVLNNKFQHFVYGIAIYALLIPFGILTAFVVLTAIAVGKEFLDRKETGVCNLKYAFVTVSGGVYLQLWYEAFEKMLSFF
jgi:lauroyl/myristoyl acyltransferase